MYLSYVGLRVTNLEKSLKFYKGALGLEEVARGDNSKSGAGVFVLLRDRKSRMKLELNWYPSGSEYDTPYGTGEGLDHVAFCVDDVRKRYAQLVAGGAGETGFGPEAGRSYCYVTDPDGNWIELYQRRRPAGKRVPKGY